MYEFRTTRGSWRGTHRSFLQVTGGTLLAGTVGMAGKPCMRGPGRATRWPARICWTTSRRPALRWSSLPPLRMCRVRSVHGSTDLHARLASGSCCIVRPAAHGGDMHDPRHQYLRCDIDDHCPLHPLTEETG